MQGKAARRQARRGPDPVDVHVAMRVRERRIELGLTQPEVAAELGITFQHLYKFEKAKSRISASRLYDLIPSPVDQDRCAQLRRPMDMIVHGWSTRRFQAKQQ